MKQLLLMRHAKSSWDHAGLTDNLRPLNERGDRVAPLMGAWLIQQGLKIDGIVTSTAIRAHQTALHVAAAFDAPPPLSMRDDLYHASIESLVNIVRSLPGEKRSVLMIGHNPGFEELACLSAGRPLPFPTASIASIELEVDDWIAFDPLSATTRLQSIWRPKEVL